MRVGLISDTHGLIRPEARSFLEDCDHMIHAGDNCDSSALAALRTIKPLSAVRGNNDRGAWAEALHETELVHLSGVTVYVILDLAHFKLNPAAAGIDVVIAGHSHKPSI